MDKYNTIAVHKWVAASLTAAIQKLVNSRN